MERTEAIAYLQEKLGSEYRVSIGLYEGRSDRLVIDSDNNTICFGKFCPKTTIKEERGYDWVVQFCLEAP